MWNCVQGDPPEPTMAAASTTEDGSVAVAPASEIPDSASAEVPVLPVVNQDAQPPAQSVAPRPSNPTNLYVDNIGEMEVDELKSHFASFGTITRATIMTDRSTGVGSFDDFIFYSEFDLLRHRAQVWFRFR